MDAELQRAARELAEARERWEHTIRKARAEDYSLRRIAELAGCSHEQVRKITETK